MKSKIQIVILMTVTALLGVSGNSWGGQQEFGKHRSGTDRLPIDVPHDIIGPACPGTNPCVK